jgi:hypothetical protein
MTGFATGRCIEIFPPMPTWSSRIPLNVLRPPIPYSLSHRPDKPRAIGVPLAQGHEVSAAKLVARVSI